MAALTTLVACGAHPRADTPRGDFSLKCADRGPPVAYRGGAVEPTRGVSEVLVSERVVVYRDDTERLVARTLAGGAVVGSSDAKGWPVLGDERAVVLWEHGIGGERRLVRVTWADGHALRSDPLPLPLWVVRSSEGEPAEAVAAASDGSDFVVAWTAQISWNGGTPPSPEEAKEAHHEDCGSLRIDAAGHVRQGGKLPSPRDVTPPPSPVPRRGYLQQIYAGEGLYWTNDIDPVTGRALHHALVETSGASIEAELPEPPPETAREDFEVWATADRVVVLRVLRRREGYEHPRSLIVLDRKTGRRIFVVAVMPLREVPPRP